MREGAMEDREIPTWPAVAEPDIPAWWPYADEFPRWHVWRGVSGLLYARWLRSSPPVVVRGEDAVDLRDQIRRAVGQMG
jgi:hypothetical protein